MMQSMLPHLRQQDPVLAVLMQQELERQHHQIELIASENIVSEAVLEAQGSVLTNKYAEGYPGKRYYEGCRYVDGVEALAIQRACELFGCAYANVQPHSGSQANQAVFLALLQPGDTILSLDLACGGHLTHGSSVNLSGKWFNVVPYHVDPKTHLIDLEEVEKLAHQHKPKLIIAGASAYPRKINFQGFRSIADAVGAYLLVDMAHIAGLVAAGVHSSPFPHAHVVTTTTHKTLRGPRGGMILAQDETMGKKLNSAIFPGLQGGPLPHVIAGKAVCFLEALQPAFKTYGARVVQYARQLGESLAERGLSLITGGTDIHYVLVNVTDKQLNGKQAANLLEQAGITCNANSVPFDPLPPSQTSGIRLGTPAGTTRGFQEAEWKQIATWTANLLEAFHHPNLEAKILATKAEVESLCKWHPIYGILK
ncbi:MAG: serine hydroxymethyltransferase [Alphaproteobacteria bacterium]